ncbi:MAG: MBL fold metallo-hydrolase [Proteobacteria bacterium]|uniref:MBL fold metallo-hydrolase n=1 Tax=Aquabacterium sp. TaxID=1872578 RepID=UPI0035C6CC5A|nr:MBL fold metallo-hydrolase [Pseudomonadota bacterium]
MSLSPASPAPCQRSITPLPGNHQRLDGGAMFGNAPRAVWAGWLPPDDQHRIRMACRGMLVREAPAQGAHHGERRILVETGIGAFFSPEMKARFGIEEPQHMLLAHLAEQGLSDADIDVVVLSHLHFDHAGGLLSAWEEGQAPRLLFPKAQFVTGRRQWERALTPHARDRASYIPEIIALLAASGRLTLVDDAQEGAPVLPPEGLPADWRLHFSDGHTPGQMLVEVPMPDGPVVFTGDLVPGLPWVHLPITMGYDRFPERVIDEKAALLDDLVARGGRILFTHDPEVAVGRLQRDAKGRYGVSERWGDEAVLST